MKRTAALLISLLSLVTVSSLVNATEQTPDPLTADLQLIMPEEQIVSSQTKSDNSESGTQESVHEYAYGDDLDIKEVISVKSDPMACNIVPATMTYRDSKGEVHTISYKVIGAGCQNG